jgi:hypothetical protein
MPQALLLEIPCRLPLFAALFRLPAPCAVWGLWLSRPL